MPDRADYRAINDFAKNTSWLHPVAIAYAKYGLVLFVFLALAVYLVGRSRNDDRLTAGAVWAVAASVVAFGVNQIFVHLINEARPYASMPDALVLIARSTDPSAPSDHSVLVGAMATGLLMVNPRFGIAAWVLALTMGLDRVYVGVHYPTDVLLGLAVGAVIAGTGGVLILKPLQRLVAAIRGTSLRPLVSATPSV